MPKFKVCGEIRIRIARDIEFDADSYEDAVAKFYALKPVDMGETRRLEPTWIGTSEHVDKFEEYEFPITGPCSWCKTPIIERDIPGQPWNYSGDPKNEHGGLVCFKCLNDGGYLDEKNRVKDEWR